jgi:alkylhydroperoxidase family enzyme
MARVPLAQLPVDVEEALRTRGAAQLNLYRALANAPAISRAWLGFLWALRDDCETPRSLRELAILRTAVRHSSAYEWHHHEAMARAADVAPEKVAAVAAWYDSDEFNAEERAVLALTDAICDGEVSEEVWQEAARWFESGELVEIVVTAATYVMVPRVLDALAVPIEKQESDEVTAQ